MEMNESLGDVLGTTLERIYNACTARKLVQLRQDCKVVLDCLDDVLSTGQSGPGGVVFAADEVLQAPQPGPSQHPVEDPSSGREDSNVNIHPPNEETVIEESKVEDTPATPGNGTGSEHDTVVDLSSQDGERGEVAQDKNVSDPISNQPLEDENQSQENGHISYKGAALTESIAADVFPIFEAAVDTKRPPLVEAVLDCFQKLVAHRHVQGVVTVVGTSLNSSPSQESLDVDDDAEGAGAEKNSTIPYQATIIDMICRSDDIQDEGVELKVLKALLTCVTSTAFCMHGQSLLLAIRTCYNIYMVSRSQVNQTTAKASLTQMLNVVFQRMEACQQDVPVSPIVVSDLLGLPVAQPHDTTSLSGFVQTFVNRVVADTLFGPSHDEVRRTVAGAFDKRSAEGDGSDTDSEPEPIVKGEESSASASHSRVQTAEQLPFSPVIEANVGTTTTVSRMDSTDPRSGIFHKDAFLVFRALCKLSINTAPELAILDSTAVRGKVLALELVKILLENSGPIFSSSERFLGAIRQFLCLSLLKNCSSSIPQALSLSSSILMTLLSKFRHHLKAEIGVFFPMILLKPIEPPIGNSQSQQPTTAVTTSYNHQLVVIRCIESKCTDGQLLVDLFVNYDCDIDQPNLFERLVMALVRKAQGSGSSVELAEKAQQQEAAIREEALRSLVNILWALVGWERKCRATDQGQVNPDLEAGSDSDSNMEDSSVENAKSRTQRIVDGPSGETYSLSSPSPIRGGNSEAEDLGPNGTGMVVGDSTKGSDLAQIRRYKVALKKGINIFNKHPIKGVEYLIHADILKNDPEEIAAFFEKTDGLDKSMIGEYLGNNKESCVDVMHAYVDGLDFSDMELDGALRVFLSGFRLPGEAQKIDRLMEKYAERYLMCNPGAFKSADVAYVLSYSMIMLNTDAHNDQVKNKMTKEGFIKNNKGIDDGMDLPEDYLSDIYDRIVDNEIKMRDDSLLEGNDHGSEIAAGNRAGAWRDLFLSLIPGRRQAKQNEPSEDAIRRTHAYLREKAKGTTFFKATEWETVRPMVEVSWAPMLGAFSVLFEEFDDQYVIELCLDEYPMQVPGLIVDSDPGFEAAVIITAQLGMAMLRNTFVSSLCRFTLLHAPHSMSVKNALAFRIILESCEQVGDNLQDNWKDVLWCVSRWELMYQTTAGGPTDASFFANASENHVAEPVSAAEKLRQKFRQLSRLGSEALGTPRSITSPGKENADSLESTSKLRITNYNDGEVMTVPQIVIQAVDIQDINRLFVNSQQLDSEAIVEFVMALCAVSDEELHSPQAPRVFSLTKIVEIAHFNMGRIRLVWSRIWAVLSDFFITVGCQENLQLAMYAVDSLRQLAMKFLERDELANYTFQNDFLKPFVVVMRQSKAVEIRELIIRCVSQMVLARVSNVKSGWKSMFMVFTTAAGDEQPTIVRLAFDTIEKIVREHFNYITETETTTFTDCVNCLIAFTNNPHSLDVALNSIAFLRYCAIKLAEGSIGDVEELPANTIPIPTTSTRIVPATSAPAEITRTASIRARRTLSHADIERSRSMIPKGIRFIDKDEHMYFWFPLLAGLSELTFDPRQEIRSSSLEVLFDTLRYHGMTFADSFWARVLDSVLFPIFDHVRAEVTDTTTFTDDKLRAQIDSWLYETCIKCLQHLVDLYLQFFSVLHIFVDRLFALLSNFMMRPHQSLASMGVAAFVRLLDNAGESMDAETWRAALAVLENAAAKTRPEVMDLIIPPERFRRERSSMDVEGGASMQKGKNSWTLRHGIGARRLHEVRSRDSVQLLLVQAIGEVYSRHFSRLDSKLISQLLRSLHIISSHARLVDCNQELRQGLAVLQAEDRLAEAVRVPDPPLLRVESESSHAYLSTLLHLSLNGKAEVVEECGAGASLVELCLSNLKRFEGCDLPRGVDADSSTTPGSPDARVVTHTSEGVPVVMASSTAESSMYSPLVVATLQAINAFPEDVFKRSLTQFFPHLTSLLACEHTPFEVQEALSNIFDRRIGPLIL